MTVGRVAFAGPLIFELPRAARTDDSSREKITDGGREESPISRRRVPCEATRLTGDRVRVSSYPSKIFLTRAKLFFFFAAVGAPISFA
jgi:hypothetical protein